MKQAGVVLGYCVLFGAAVVVGQGAGSGQAGAPSQTAGAAQTQGRGGPPPTLVVEVQNMFNALKRNISAAADEFPEDKYAWAPTPAVRTWAALMGHIADDNNGACFALAGETERPARLDNGGVLTEPAKAMKKADFVRVLAESFARCDKAFASVTPENMLERQGNRSKIGALIYNTQHVNEHYGNIATYMRLQNLVPPSTSGTARGRGGFNPGPDRR
jgi:hypothetical protein